MKSIKHRLLSLLLTLVTVLSLLPTAAFAASNTGSGLKITTNQAYWSTRLLANGTPYSYRPPLVDGKLVTTAKYADEEVLLRPGQRPSRILADGERARLAAHGINPLQSLRAAEGRGVALKTLAGGSGAAVSAAGGGDLFPAFFIADCTRRMSAAGRFGLEIGAATVGAAGGAGASGTMLRV